MPRAWLINPFRDYADRVVGSFRFGQDQKTRDFIESVLATAERSKRQIEPGKKSWRAQLGHEDIVSVVDENGDWAYDSIRPYTAERMTASSRFVKNGRVNPVGIAYWYCATDPETAVAEMRPWQGAVLTVAELKATRNLRFVDCGDTHPIAADSDLERYVWDSISEAFSRSVAPGTFDVDYVPTQMLAEAFRMKGFDGIQYKSHLGEGINVVVFDLSAFALGKRQLWTAKRVSYELECHGDEMQEC
ncbi:MAG: RES family NAD+ phosphorylase [Candidatus Solibacter sp.]|nr:RES family NAD+ phosphorylase [Candidatus Solibacter sp.]